MSKRARDRQLAKLAARRQAERKAARRRRDVAIGVGGALVAAAAIVFGLTVFGGDPSASPSPTPSDGPVPGTRTGTVQPGTAPAQVACGAEKPAEADEPKPQFAGPPPVEIVERATYTATLRTSCGDIVIRLLNRRAPQTANSFVFLAREGYFDGTFFHRLVDSIDVIQGGDPTGAGSGGPGYEIQDETDGSESYDPGVIAMAESPGGLPGSQFFIITGPGGHNLDGNPDYTIFGKVVEGLDIAKRINALPIEGADDGPPTQAIYLERVTIKEKVAPSPSATPSATPSP